MLKYSLVITKLKNKKLYNQKLHFFVHICKEIKILNFDKILLCLHNKFTSSKNIIN